MNRIKKIWHLIKENGVDEQALGREVVKVRLLNQLVVIAFTVSLVNVPMYLLQGDKILYLWSNLGNVTLEASCIFLAYKRRHQAARAVAVFLFPTLMALHVIVHGLNFGSIFTTLGILAFILYEGHRRIQFSAIFYICFLFISTKLYVINTFDNTFLVHNYNELIHFPIILTALGLMLLLYQKELKKYEIQQNVLINNLEYKNKELFQINEELERFTYIASHDLKTPLRSISNHLDLIKIHLDCNNKTAVYDDLKSAKIGSKQMYALISDILEYKELNNLKSTKETLDLNEILIECLTNIDKKLSIDNVEILNNGLPKVKGHKQEFVLLLRHLIDNGIRYNTSQTPKIEINTITGDSKILISIKDNGIGIAPEYHKKVFQFFKRLHRNEDYEGTGIGLGLCQKIVHRYHGTIHVESTNNEGATFIIKLPTSLLDESH